VPEPWRGNVTASLELIDDLEDQIAQINKRLKEGHADHPYIPLLMSAPGIGWVLAFTIAAEIGEIEGFSSPEKLTGYTGLFPRVDQSGDKDRRGPLTKHGPTYLRWAMLEATMHALKHPAYAGRYRRNKRRLGKQRGAKVAQIDIARRLAHAIWHMLTRNQKFSPRRRFSSGGLTALLDLRPRAKHPICLILPPRRP
jgi:transposase